MKHFDRELELGFNVSAAQMGYHFKKGDLTPFNQLRIEQVWLEQGEIGEYKVRRRIRKEEDLTLGTIKYEYTTKYSKNGERSAAQDNMELNAPLTAKEYGKLFEIYSAEADVKKTRKIRTYFKDRTGDIYTLDSYPDSDKARVEIEFQSKKTMDKWIPPQWLVAAIAVTRIKNV